MARNKLKNAISEYIRPSLPGSTTIGEADLMVGMVLDAVDTAIRAAQPVKADTAGCFQCRQFHERGEDCAFCKTKHPILTGDTDAPELDTVSAKAYSNERHEKCSEFR